jgi:hypothetical protein
MIRARQALLIDPGLVGPHIGIPERAFRVERWVLLSTRKQFIHGSVALPGRKTRQ